MKNVPPKVSENYKKYDFNDKILPTPELNETTREAIDFFINWLRESRNVVDINYLLVTEPKFFYFKEKQNLFDPKVVGKFFFANNQPTLTLDIASKTVIQLIDKSPEIFDQLTPIFIVVNTQSNNQWVFGLIPKSEDDQIFKRFYLYVTAVRDLFSKEPQVVYSEKPDEIDPKLLVRTIRLHYNKKGFHFGLLENITNTVIDFLNIAKFSFSAKIVDLLLSLKLDFVENILSFCVFNFFECFEDKTVKVHKIHYIGLGVVYFIVCVFCTALALVAVAIVAIICLP
jgi:hypothetical protein